MPKKKHPATKKTVVKPTRNNNTTKPLCELDVPVQKAVTGNKPSSTCHDAEEHRWRANIQQLELLASAMEQSPQLALSLAKSREERDQAQRKWDRIATMLNQIGAVGKTGRGWLRYWTDLKFKVRRKHAYITSQPEGQSSVKLTSFERRLVKILTDGDGNLLFNTAVGPKELDPLPDDDPEVIYIKTETAICNESSSPATIPSDTDEPPDSQGVPAHTQDTITTDEKKIRQLKIENLQFELQRRKEFHDLEKSQFIEKHKIELEILQAKKQKVLRDFDRQYNRGLNREQNRGTEKVDGIHIVRVNGSELTGEPKFRMHSCHSCSTLTNTRNSGR